MIQRLQSHIRYALPAILLFLLTAIAAPAVAQFSAPTPTSSRGLNIRRPITTDPAILYPADRELQILPGDLLRVSVYGVDPAYLDVERVALDGTVRLNMAGIIQVAGLSVQGAESNIAHRFEQLEMFRNPQVAIEIAEAPGQIATVLGEVHGVVPVLGRKRLYDVLATLGGLNAAASSVITIDRPGLPDPITVDLGNDPAHSAGGNIPIFAGDTISVGRVGVYYVVGALRTQGATPLNGIAPITAIQAMALAGGPNFDAELDDARLIRTVGTERTVLHLHLGKILKGREPDPVLQTDDILLIPSSIIKTVIRSGGLTSAIAISVSLAALLSR